MATQAKCERCKVRIDYGVKCRIPLRRLPCPWCRGPVKATSSNFKKWPSIRRGPDGVWPKQHEGGLDG